jgi:small-conductance mechanosensitive channel
MTALLAATGSQATSGYLYELLRALGVSPGAAGHAQDLLLRPLTIVLIVVVAAVVAHFGSSIIRRSLHSLRARAEARSEARAEARAAAATRQPPGSEGTGEPYSPAGREPARLTTVMSRIDMFGRIAANIWRVVVWVIAVLSILGVLGIDLAPFVAGATIIGATIGFGAQTLVKDYLSGFLLLAEDQFRIGDDIETASASGVVDEMTLRVTRLKGDDGTVWYVPNGDIRTLGNTSRASASSYVDVLVPIGVPVERTGRVIAEAAVEAVSSAGLQASCLEAPDLLGVEDMDGTALTFRVALHTVPGDGAPVARAVRAGVVTRLLAEGLLTSQLAAAEEGAADGPAPPATPPA